MSIIGLVLALIVGVAVIIAIPARILMGPWSPCSLWGIWEAPWAQLITWVQLIVRSVVAFALVALLSVVFRYDWPSLAVRHVVTILLVVLFARYGFYYSIKRQLEGVVPRGQILLERWGTSILLLLLLCFEVVGLYHAIFG